MQQKLAQKGQFSCPDEVLWQCCSNEFILIPDLLNKNKKIAVPVIRRKRNEFLLRRLSMPATQSDAQSVFSAPRSMSFCPELLLHSAVMENNAKDLAKLIKETRVNINQPNNLGRFPIHEAAGEGFVECTKILIENGANLTVQTREGMNPLEAAVIGGSFECAELLIKHGAPVDKIKDGFHDAVNL